MHKLSATIITLNEERRIEKCLRSLFFFVDEIVVVDSESSDRTVELAEKLGARVIKQAWLGYGKQKQFAVAQATNQWVLCLDADEYLSDELQQSIKNMLMHPLYSAYQFPRRNRFMGRWLKHGEGYPDYSLRIFHKKYAHWSSAPIHEKVVTAENIGRMSGDLLHESEETISQYLEKQNRYTTLQAQQIIASGKHGVIMRFVKMLLSPLIRFIKFYIFRRGFLDGLPGLVHILIGCRNSFMKQKKSLW